MHTAHQRGPDRLRPDSGVRSRCGPSSRSRLCARGTEASHERTMGRPGPGAAGAGPSQHRRRPRSHSRVCLGSARGQRATNGGAPLGLENPAQERAAIAADVDDVIRAAGDVGRGRAALCARRDGQPIDASLGRPRRRRVESMCRLVAINRGGAGGLVERILRRVRRGDNTAFSLIRLEGCT